jgi:RNA polymerase sigma-70 factor (ECF subfamily)
MNLSPLPRVLLIGPTRVRDDRHILRTELLVTQFQRGDRSAFAALVRLWERPLFYYLRRLAPTEADAWDLLQETWIKVLRGIRSIRDARATPAFLYATARNLALTRLRLRQPPIDDSPADGQLRDASCAFLAFDDAEQVHHALDQLPLPQREAVTLYFLEDLSIDEIARVLDVPPGTVKSRLHYGKQAIKRIIENGESR